MVLLWIGFCRSILEQSCVLWNSWLTLENREDLDRTTKTFAKLVLEEHFQNYSHALNVLGLEKYQKLDTRISGLRPYRSDYPPWILKRGWMESSCRIPSSLYWKTKRMAFFIRQNKKKSKKTNLKKWFYDIFLVFSTGLDFLTIFDNFWTFMDFCTFFFWIFGKLR